MHVLNKLIPKGVSKMKSFNCKTNGKKWKINKCECKTTHYEDTHRKAAREMYGDSQSYVYVIILFLMLCVAFMVKFVL